LEKLRFIREGLRYRYVDLALIEEPSGQFRSCPITHRVPGLIPELPRPFD